MTLRVRLGIAAGIAVAVAVIAVAVTAYVGTRSELRGQLDQQLRSLAHPILARAGVLPGPSVGGGPGPGGAPPGAGGGGPGAAGGGPGIFSAPGNDCDHGLGIDRTLGQGFGAAQGFVQLVDASGSICLANGETTSIPVDASVRGLAKAGRGSYLTDKHIGSTHLRVLTYGVGQYGALQVALPLTNVDSTLSSQLLLTVIIAAAGIALAALLGILVARTALAPIARFTRRTESIAANPERLGSRLEVTGNDELARLAQTFNTTLDALERSIESQRNLVADASHELRTPIASLRANLQLLRDESRLASEDRDALRQDMIDELDELTGLVGDVVELARGTKPTGVQNEVRLDAVVSELVERTRRRAPELTVEASLEPTLVRGEGDRIARAIANLLDNARKWSPPGGLIEVTLKQGDVSVRDYGPGFHEDDLPFVFDRFHRARDARSKPGSGLGLAIVRQAAEAHGGTAVVANASGGGALLRVSFGQPLEIDDALIAAAAASASRPAGTSGDSGTGTPEA
jgi:two-component system sensor histidine kinase MprB